MTSFDKSALTSVAALPPADSCPAPGQRRQQEEAARALFRADHRTVPVSIVIEAARGASLPLQVMARARMQVESLLGQVRVMIADDDDCPLLVLALTIGDGRAHQVEMTLLSQPSGQAQIERRWTANIAQAGDEAAILAAVNTATAAVIRTIILRDEAV